MNPPLDAPLAPHVDRYRANLQSEVDSAALYRGLADAEANEVVAELYRRLAAVEENHAAFWQQKLADAGVRVELPRPGWRTRMLVWLAHRVSADLVAGTAATLEHIDRGRYDAQPEARGTPMPRQERSHARLLRELSRGRRAGWSGPLFARLEGRHAAGGGNALRAAVLGANDGLVSNLSLVMGASGAAFSEHTVLVTGLAGLLAGACSMALGEWLSVQNAREMYEREIAVEPDEEKQELVLIYKAKGLADDKALALAERVMSSPDVALDTLAREELGIDPDDLGGSPWVAACASFIVFSLGALVPVAPFVVLGGLTAVAASAALSAIGLAFVGATVTIFTGRNAWWSALRQVIFGLAAAAITYAVGFALRVSTA
jgi:VIT1/CCC1 family predicted Fe2+/Mn2+ transporter